MDGDILTEREFELGGKEWQIKPLDAFNGKYVFYKHVRPLVSVVGDMQITKTNDEGEEELLPQVQIALGVIGRMPQEHLVKLTDTLIDRCLFLKSADEGGRYYPVKGNKEEAFAGLKVSDLTVLDARLFAVNFGESVSDLIQSFLVPPAGAESQQ